jgi:hypothetical protein
MNFGTEMTVISTAIAAKDKDGSGGGGRDPFTFSWKTMGWCCVVGIGIALLILNFIK